MLAVQFETLEKRFDVLKCLLPLLNPKWISCGSDNEEMNECTCTFLHDRSVGFYLGSYVDATDIRAYLPHSTVFWFS